MSEPKTPKTKREWALYRVMLKCKVGQDALSQSGDMETLPGISRGEYALHCLLGAVEEIAEVMMEDEASHAANPSVVRKAFSPKDDKCSWNLIGMPYTLFRYQTTCRDDFVVEFDAEKEGFKYCPYCGKPIVLDDNPKTGKDAQ